MNAKRKAVAVVAMVVAGLPVGAGAASSEIVEHCVVEVVDQLDTGEFVLSDPVCYETFAEAVLDASSGAVQLDADAVPSDLEEAGKVAALLSTFTLGIHYDGYSGGGSSISVVGSSCSGGYWNTPPAWDDRISSTWNGCYRVTHHDLPNKGGAYGSTYGTGSIHNVPSGINNKAESVSYWSS